MGALTLIQNGDTTVIDGTIVGLSEGNHGFHIHEDADIKESCDGAGKHYNPKGVDHGGPNDSIRHVGDLGNLNSASIDGFDLRSEDYSMVL